MKSMRTGLRWLWLLLLLLANVVLPATVQARPSAEDITAYDDALASGWIDGSFNATIDYDSTTVHHSGAKSIAVTTTANGALKIFPPDPAPNATDYASISFWVYGAAGGSSIGIFVGDTSDAPHIINAAAGVWTPFDIPLTDLSNLLTIESINWQDATGAGQPTFYVDDIVVKAKGSTPPPTGIPDNTSDGSYGFQPGPSGVAVAPNGRVYATVYKTNHIYSWPSAASMVSGAAPDKTFGDDNGDPDDGCPGPPSPTRMCGPESIAVDSQGNLFVADTYYNRILVFLNPDTNGTPTKADSVLGQLDLSLNARNMDSDPDDGVKEGFCYVRGLAVDSSDRLWVVDEFNYRVVRFDTPTALNGFPSKVFGQANMDVHAAVCSDTPEGSGNTGAGQFSLPLGVAVDQEGNVFVTDFDNNRVQRFAAGAANGAAAEETYSDLNHPHDVAVDGAGNLYIANTFNNEVLVFAGGANGDLTSDYSFPGRNFPMGMAFTPAGDFLVADCGSGTPNPGDYPPCVAGTRGVYFFAAPPPAENQPPVAGNDAKQTLKNTAVTGNVLTNDSDPQGGALTVTGNTQPSQGTVTVAANGDYTFTPATDFVGTTTFDYTVSNTAALTDTGTVTIKVVEEETPEFDRSLFMPSLAHQED
jgi:sugar lactone lactonase YvrE